jgi:ribosomal protein S16
MISAELVHLFRQLLHPLQRNVWYSIYVTDSYNPTLNTAIQLDEEDYTSLIEVGNEVTAEAQEVPAQSPVDNHR